jgi:hypothetical protein
MASKIRNIQLLENIFGERTKYILTKFENEKIKLTNRSSNFVTNLSNTIFNYVDFIHKGDMSVIENKSINEIQSEYNEWFESNKSTYLLLNKPKNEHIIFDYRINNIGYYWVDLKSNHSSEMVFNMENCGRVGVNQNILVLREQKESGENLMQVAISISKDFYILQIKGREDKKPLSHYSQILDFLLRYEPINGFKWVYNPENDFKISDLNNEDKSKLKTTKPHLFGKFI